METFLEEVKALRVPLWTAEDLTDRTARSTCSFLGEGAFGVAHLYSGADGSSVVVKRIPLSDDVDSFMDEVRALAKVRGTKGI